MLNRLCIEAEAEARRAVEQTEQYALAAGAKRAGLRGRKQRIAILACTLKHHEFANDDIDPGACVLAESFLGGFVAAQLRDAVERARYIGEPWRRSEIGARGHDQTLCGVSRIIRPLRATAADGWRRKAPASAIADRARPVWRRNWPTSRLRRASCANNARGRARHR